MRPDKAIVRDRVLSIFLDPRICSNTAMGCLSSGFPKAASITAPIAAGSRANRKANSPTSSQSSVA